MILTKRNSRQWKEILESNSDIKKKKCEQKCCKYADKSKLTQSN